MLQMLYVMADELVQFSFIGLKVLLISFGVILGVRKHITNEGMRGPILIA